MTICTNCDSASKRYVGDIGTDIIVDTCVDLTTATLTHLLIEKPDLTTDTWEGAVYETTKIRYVIQAGDLDQAGEYFVQAYVEMPGWSGKGETDSFKVHGDFA